MLGLVEFGWTFAFQIINFLILYFVLRKYLFKPVTGHMNSRTEKIENAFKEAESKKKEANELHTEYMSKLDNIKEERNQIIKEATRRAEERGNEIVKAAELDAKKILERASQDIEREKQKAINELKDQLSTLAIITASKVIEKELDQQAHQQLIQQFIDEVGEVTWQN